MRRSDKEINDRYLLESILQKSIFGHMSLCDDEEPYCVPVNFVFHNNAFYIHSAADGRKLEVLKKNNRVSFQTEIFAELVEGENPCSYGMRYASIISSGRAHLLSSPEEKRKALELIAHKYSKTASSSFSDKQVEAVACIRIEIDSLTGKVSGYSPEDLKRKLHEIE